MNVWNTLGKLVHPVPVLVLVAAGAASAQDCPHQAGVLLNEILADPGVDWDGDGVSDFRDDEWVEIVNNSSSTVSLQGYRLAGADTTWRYEFAGTLNPGEVRVVFGSQSVAWEAATGNPQFGLRLSNAGGRLGLWRLTETDTVLVDCYTYQDHEADDDRSTGRAPDGAEPWRVFDGMNAYTGSTEPTGTGCMPTPGGRLSCPTPTERRSWGQVKGRYLN